jgi:hypothetical protein
MATSPYFDTARHAERIAVDAESIDGAAVVEGGAVTREGADAEGEAGEAAAGDDAVIVDIDDGFAVGHDAGAGAHRRRIL